jgi:hypothetical protein
MTLVNETGQKVQYWISAANQADCGTIDVDGYVDLPQWDNQAGVSVGFDTDGTGQTQFTIECANTGIDQQVEMLLAFELGDQSSQPPQKTNQEEDVR